MELAKLFAAFTAFMGLFAIILLISLLLIKIGWALFMVPVFHMVDISWSQALGLALLASIFKSSSVKKN